MLPVADEKFVLIGFRALHTDGGIRIGIGLLTSTLALIWAIASFMFISIDVRPNRSGINTRKHGLQKILQL